MRIVHIIPGSGGSFYCGNCLRDSKYYKALMKQGHDVITVPMYLPLFEHDIPEGQAPVFYGAVSLYLKQTYPFFKNAPKWLDNMLNTRPVLMQAAKMAGSTRAKGLEEMTISMLLGEQGDQAEELEQMIRWLEEHYRPDVIHLSNALLLGLAGRLKSRLGVPVVCSLQDEDVWVDVMSEASRKAVWKLMSEKSEDVAAFVSVSHYFTRFIKGKMNIDDQKIHTLHLGIDPDDYHFNPQEEKDRSIGFISRMCESNGLDILVDAFIMLKKDISNQDVKLYITGGNTGDDEAFIKEQKKKVVSAGIENDVIYLSKFEDEYRHIFFDRVSLLSVPVRKGEAFGIYLAEAMASGIPVVQPAVGAFTEIVEATGGGVTYNDNTAQKLAEALGKVLKNKNMLKEMSLNARKGVEEKFNINIQAKKLTDIYQELL